MIGNMEFSSGGFHLHFHDKPICCVRGSKASLEIGQKAEILELASKGMAQPLGVKCYSDF